MQSKIRDFFKPCVTETLDSSQLFDQNEDTFDSTKEPEIRITYSRRTPKTDTCRSEEKDDRGNREEPMASGSANAVAKPVNRKRTYAQSYLELGQTNFHLQHCSICGLKYSCGEEEDEKVHREFHKNYTHGVPFKGWRKERVVPVDLCEGSRIILVLDSDPSAWKNKVQEVAEMMEGELGLREGWLLHEFCKIYLFISGQRVAGCLVAEPILTGYKVVSSSGVQRSSNNSKKVDTAISNVLQFGTVNFCREITKRGTSNQRKELAEDHNGAIFCEEEAVPATCGVRAIWVAPNYRRKHIATKLLDAARSSFCTGYVLEQSQLAFSQPTSAGKALASTYSCTASFLVYNTGSKS